MQTVLNLLSVAIIGGADGPTVITVAGDLPLPAIFVSFLGVLFVAYVYIAKAIRRKALPAEAVAVIETPTRPVADTPVQTVYAGPVLVGVEEKEAAVIMAIVSHKTGIPLNRLRFDSIKLMED